MTNWNEFDDEFFLEYAKFDKALGEDTILYGNDSYVLYCKPNYATLKEITNQWNKQRFRIIIQKIKILQGLADEISEEKYALDMGKRLLRSIREHAISGTKYLKILRLGLKFDTEYYVSEYKPKIKAVLPATAPTTRKKKESK